MNEAATLLYFGETIGCVLFVALFLLRSRGWWRSRMGPNLLAMMFVLAVLQSLGVFSRLPMLKVWFMAHADAIRFWSFLALFIVVWWRVILLIRIQHEDAEAALRDAAGAREDAEGAREDAEGAREDAVGARADAAGAREEAVEARRDVKDARQMKRDTSGMDDTDPELKKVGS